MLPLLTALSPAIGGLFAGAMSYAGARSANASNRRITSSQNQFQSDMSNTAYQRSMEDMRRAGLNPMLAYQQGGASTPSGSSIPSLDTAAPAMSSALQSARLRADLDNIHANTSKTMQDTLYSKALENSAYADQTLKFNSARAAQAQAHLLELQIPGAKNRAALDSSDFGKSKLVFDSVTNSLGGATNVVKPFGKTHTINKHYH